ncbi:MAG: phytanoyl-CoA dioxygenase family protein [Gammaproteobacteria bacterium]|nr:phytanoyl-CoA dioxygenase family protein [Gammaproteobacteria bacterium]
MTMQSDTDDYFAAGLERARALDNRGPLRFDADGRLATEIREAFDDIGFYIFEGLLDDAELAELDADLDALLARTPRTEGAQLDRRGRPVDPEARLPQLLWARPLADPWGGTELLNGRHPVRMEEPTADTAAPESAIFLMLGLFECMDSALRLSAHPDVLRVAEAICGGDFVPYNDSIFLKEPGLGASIAWHQDGTTHWDSPAWHPLVHGVNFMAQLRRTTPANALWTVPGTHRNGRVDLRARVAANGDSTRLPDAVPMLCERGDIAVQNRQCVHGSFANASPDPRISFVWGFFPRSAVEGVEVEMPRPARNAPAGRRRYDAAAIAERAGVMQLAIDARHAHRPAEAPYRYAATVADATLHRDDHGRREALRGYARGTIFI